MEIKDINQEELEVVLRYNVAEDFDEEENNEQRLEVFETYDLCLVIETLLEDLELRTIRKLKESFFGG